MALPTRFSQCVKTPLSVLCRALSGQQMAAEVNEKPVETSIISKLSDAFSPSHLQVINESFMHSVPKDSETHFKVIIVSDKFENVALINRHRMVNETLKDEMGNPVHALSIEAKTPSQWEISNHKVSTTSPPCRGGFGL